MNFNNIKGHQNQLNYLSRIKNGGSIPHAFLFTGPHGIGKRLIADTFAASLFCSSENSPCGRCHSCLQVEAGSFPDFVVLEKDDKGKIPIGSSDRSQPGTVRWMIDRLTRSSVHGRYVVIIDGVETISEGGQNALLKTVEEPGPGSNIILIAESKSGILPTIVSRCVEFNFNPLSLSDITGIVNEKFPGGGNIPLISSICGGSAETALRLCDEKVFESVMSICREIKSLMKGGAQGSSSGEIPMTGDGAFLLNVLINTFSYMVREHVKGGNLNLPEDIILDVENAEKAVKILLAIKKGLKNNLNVKNILKGMIYSVSEMNFRGFPEPDFSWL